MGADTVYAMLIFCGVTEWYRLHMRRIVSARACKEQSVRSPQAPVRGLFTGYMKD